MRVPYGRGSALAPEWVARAPPVAAALPRRLRSVTFSWLERPPLLRYREKERRPPPRLQGETGRLRGARGQNALREDPASLCVLPHRLLNVFLDIAAGLREGRNYVEGLANEYKDYFGNVGVNADAQLVNKAAATCWNWAFLVTQRPTTTEVDAFVRLFVALKPVLQKGAAADHEAFPYAVFPATPKAVAWQYLLLCSRIRSMEAATGCFTRPAQVVVSSLRFRATVVSLQLRKQRLGGFSLPLFLISAFTAELPGTSPAPCFRASAVAAPCFRASAVADVFGATLPGVAGRRLGELQAARQASGAAGAQARPDVRLLAECAASFALDPAALCLPGAYAICRLDKRGRARSGARAKQRAHRARPVPTRYAVIVQPPLQGKLVQIVSTRREVDVALVARAIDMDPSISRPSDTKVAGAVHCYHACEVHHFSRLLHPSEAACERWGSLLHQLFDDEQNLQPWRMANRLFLRESGLQFIGDPRDEEFLSTVVGLLEHGDGRRRKASAPSCPPQPFWWNFG